MDLSKICKLFHTRIYNNEISTWETQLEMKYDNYFKDDFKETDASSLMNKRSVILQSLTPPKLQQMEGTENQSSSERWLYARRLGQLVIDKNPSSDARAFKFTSSYVWGINRESFQT